MLPEKSTIEIDRLLCQNDSFHPNYEQPVRSLDIFYENKNVGDSFEVFTYRGSEYQTKKIQL